MPPTFERDEDWQNYRDYADRVIVAVRVVAEQDDSEPLEVWSVALDGHSVDRDWLERSVASLPYAGATEQAPMHDHYIDQHERRTEWGASAATVTLLLTVAVGVGTNALWDATKALARNMAEQVKERGLPTEAQPLSDAEAIHRALWFVEARYGESPSALRVTGVDLNPYTDATITLDANSGWRYEVRLTVEAGIVFVARIRRWRD